MCHHRAVSIQRYETADGTRWRVRWREPDGKMRSKTLANKSEAQALDIDLKAKKLRGDLLPTAGRWTLDQSWDEWLDLRRPDLSPATLETYETLWEAHIRGTLVGRSLVGELVSEPKRIEDHLAALKAGDPANRRREEDDKDSLGPAAKRKLLMLLSGVFSECVRWRRIYINPIREMRKPSAVPQRAPRPLPPIVIERLRCSLLDAEEEGELMGQASACLVSLMAYAGLRPQEALALQFRDVGKSVITVDKAIKMGDSGTEIGPTKTRRKRAVPVVPVLADDIAVWRTIRGDPGDGEPLFATERGGWTLPMYRNWRYRIWRPAVQALAASDPENLSWLAKVRPYDCRGSFVSLHLRGGVPAIDVAKYAGHSPAVMFNHYAEVIEELAGQAQLPADEQIRRARAVVSEEAAERVVEMTSESLKAPDDMDDEVMAILYGDHPRGPRSDH